MPTFEDTYLPKSKPDEEGLLRFGFVKDGEEYAYQTEIMEGEFLLYIRVRDMDVTTKLIETSSGEPYELYRIESAHGDYVGSVRDAVKAVLLAMRNACYVVSWTQRKQAKAVLDYLKDNYGEEVEYPWDDYDFGVIRRKDNEKWICLFMYLPVSKVGIAEDRLEVIMNIRRLGSEVDNKVFYPAYHMTKKTWVSMVLDESVPTEEILSYVEESRVSAGKDKKRK